MHMCTVFFLQAKMKAHTIVAVSCLLPCVLAGLLPPALSGDPRTVRSGVPVLCKSPPLPSLDTDALLSKLQPYLDQVDQNVQAALKEDKSTGGAVLSVVYKNTTIWTKGYGLVDMSSEPCLCAYMCVVVVYNNIAMIN